MELLGRAAKKYGISFWDGEIHTQLCEYTKNQWVGCFKWEKSTAHEVLLDKVLKKKNPRVSVVAQWKQIRLGTMRLWVRSLALLSGLRIQCCRGL